MLKPLAIASAILVVSVATPAQAAYEIDVQQIGADVVASGSGSINLQALTFDGSFLPPAASVMAPDDALLLVGTGSYSEYSGFSGPLSIGSGGLAFGNSSSGGLVGMWGRFDVLVLPLGYVSGSALTSSTGTWNNSTFASLGLTPGNYVWNWGRESSADTFTVRIGNAVPEPATWAMMLLGFGLVGGAMRTAKRRQKIAISYA